MDRRAWQAPVHGLAKSQTWLRDFHFHGFSKSHLGMWEPNHKEGWAVKDWCLWIVVLEKTLESPLDCKEIKPVNPKGNQPWIITGRADAETEALILWLPDAKNQLIWKDPDAGEDWRWDEKRTTEDEMWQHDVMTWWWKWDGKQRAWWSDCCAMVHVIDANWGETIWVGAKRKPVPSPWADKCCKLGSNSSTDPLKKHETVCGSGLPTIY